MKIIIFTKQLLLAINMNENYKLLDWLLPPLLNTEYHSKFDIVKNIKSLHSLNLTILKAAY